MDLSQTQKGQSVCLNISRYVTDSRVGAQSFKHSLLVVCLMRKSLQHFIRNNNIPGDVNYVHVNCTCSRPVDFGLVEQFSNIIKDRGPVRYAQYMDILSSCLLATSHKVAAVAPSIMASHCIQKQEAARKEVSRKGPSFQQGKKHFHRSPPIDLLVLGLRCGCQSQLPLLLWPSQHEHFPDFFRQT